MGTRRGNAPWKPRRGTVIILRERHILRKNGLILSPSGFNFMVTNEPFTHGSQQLTVSEGLYFRRDFPIWTSTKNVFPGLVHRHISIFHEIDTECPS